MENPHVPAIVQVPQECEERLRTLVNVFLSENSRINLSAHRTGERCWVGNVLDSLAALPLIPSLARPTSTPASILDLGTGGGFPLLPIAICLPEWHCTGIDAVGKKVAAVERIAAALELSNVQSITGRSEELGHDQAHRERYDIVMGRAVANVSVLLEWTAPFASVGGHVVLWKSMDIEAELAASARAQEILGCRFTRSHVYDLPSGFGTRQLLVFRKTSRTPSQHPRTVGLAKKKPLR